MKYLTYAIISILAIFAIYLFISVNSLLPQTPAKNSNSINHSISATSNLNDKEVKLLDLPLTKAESKEDANNPLYVEKEIYTTHDDFKKYTQYSGPDCITDGELCLETFAFDKAHKTYVTAKIDAFNSVEAWGYRIYVKTWYHDSKSRRFYEAYDSNGNKLKFHLASSDMKDCKFDNTEMRCKYDEHLVLSINRDYLQKNSSNGIILKISGEQSDIIMSIPRGYIRGFLKALPPESQ